MTAVRTRISPRCLRGRRRCRSRRGDMGTRRSMSRIGLCLVRARMLGGSFGRSEVG